VPPIDRTAILRNAEKLLRQGKVDLAIAEYLRVVEEQPRDWNTANVLGDLYIRAGQIDKAVEQYTRIADSLAEEGFLPKAGALYKKILKIKPDHEHALIQGAEIASSQGLLADARSYLNTVAERRRSRGDARGAAQIRIRLGNLDPADFEARATAARARVEIGDTPGALRDLKEIAAELTEKSRDAEAIEVLREAAGLSPDDEELRERLLTVYIGAGDFARARDCASTAPQFKALAAALEAKGHPDHALEALRQAARLEPDDAELKATLARAFVARGDLATAAEYLTVESAGSDPRLLLTVAEMRLRGGRIDEGVEIIKRLLAEDPSRREDIALLGWSVAEQVPDAGFRIVELAADTAVAQGDWAGAAAALQEFVTRVTGHVPALMRLVEICVDGGLEATMYSAQGQLADAYIEAGAAAEARFIAEDLVAREPWERTNVERFRRALVLLGEPDPDALIAERLSGQSPFTSTDLSFGDLPPFEETPAKVPPPPEPIAVPAAKGTKGPRAAEPEPEPAPDVDAPAAADAARAAAAPAPKPGGAKKGGRKGKREEAEESGHFALSSNAIDLESILGEFESPAREDKKNENAEVDLSVVLDDFKRGASQPAATPVAPTPPPGAAAGDDLNGVFERLRDQASKQVDAAEAELKKGLALRNAGKIDDAIAALQAASRAPKLRFQTASLLGRIYVERKALPQAIEWFERAAQAPAPTAADGHLLLYELADALEGVGEVARALAICLELQADAGDYRDVSARVDRLSKVQTRG
jgi:tetratricopeptide (TPR) repeat protein